MLDIYSYQSVRDLLLAVIEMQGAKWGAQTRLAEAAGCQKAYFSRVLKGKATLSQDQAFGVAKHLRLSDDETEFFMLLTNVERAASRALIAHLQRRLDDVRTKKRRLEENIKGVEFIASETSYLYHSAWFWSAVHILVSIPGFQEEQSIASKLQLPVELVRGVLEKLSTQGFVAYTDSGWTIKKIDVHIPRDSLAVLPYHQSWRQKAMSYQALKRESDFFYTSVQSVSRRDVESLRAMVWECSRSVREAVRASIADEELVVFNCDFFIP